MSISERFCQFAFTEALYFLMRRGSLVHTRIIRVCANPADGRAKIDGNDKKIL